jgi:hypothetical protein
MLPLAYGLEKGRRSVRCARSMSAIRTLHVLKAALNHALREGRVTTDEAGRRVVPFREADAPKIRYLDATEAKRLVNATAGSSALSCKRRCSLGVARRDRRR